MTTPINGHEQACVRHVVGVAANGRWDSQGPGTEFVYDFRTLLQLEELNGHRKCKDFIEDRNCRRPF